MRAALRSARSADWTAAVAVELAAHARNGTWRTAAQLPKGRTPLPGKWVFKIKYDENGDIQKFKARLVVKGFRQRAEVDYHDTFAPTLRIPTFRALCALSAKYRWVIHQMDVSTAFLMASLEEEIYMTLPEWDLVRGAVPSFSDGPVVRLIKTLYGLKQSPRAYFQHFCSTLSELRFVQSSADPCLWIRVDGDILVAALAFWVDDVVICAPGPEVRAIKLALQRHYQMTDAGPATWFLGVRIGNDAAAGRVTLDQGPGILRILRQTSMADCKPLATPCDGSLQRPLATVPDEEELAFMRDKPYRSLVGALLYLLFTRPDIAFAVNQLSRFLASPRRVHWLAAVRVLRYLKGTMNLGLCYSGEEESAPAIVGYSDADWAGDRDTRRSTTGFIFTLCGGPIAWRTKLQKSVALSTTEAEIMALAATFQEAVWLRRLAHDLRLPIADSPTVIYEDNQGAIALVKDHRFSDRSKHIDIRYFYIREHLEQDTFNVIFRATAEMLADLLTKSLGRVIFLNLIRLLGMVDVKLPQNNNDASDKNK
jgi:hypothetical protein